MLEYKIITEKTQIALETAVQALLNEGWTSLAGGVCVTTTRPGEERWTQSLSREKNRVIQE